jgi:hypothetical protein
MYFAEADSNTVRHFAALFFFALTELFHRNTTRRQRTGVTSALMALQVPARDAHVPWRFWAMRWWERRAKMGSEGGGGFDF